MPFDGRGAVARKGTKLLRGTLPIVDAVAEPLGLPFVKLVTGPLRSVLDRVDVRARGGAAARASSHGPVAL